MLTAFEVFMRKTLRLLHRSDRAMLNRIRGMGLDEMKKEFAKVGAPIVPPGREWQAIMGMKEVRNCVTHSGSRPDKERAKRLANYKIPVARSKMVLPDGYFKTSSDLVEDACERIAKDCQNALRERRKSTN